MGIQKTKVVVLTGAGISAESGIKTFRDADGLWEGHDVMSVASPEGWAADPAMVLDFYNQRRAQLQTVAPNAAHLALAALEENHHVVIVTQNVDDLHERAGSSHIIHLHGQLTKARSVSDPDTIIEIAGNIQLGDLAPNGGQLRPHIVWFGEAVPMIEKAIEEVQSADIILIVGTSMQVYPAAGLVQYAPYTSHIYYIDPKPHISHELALIDRLTVIRQAATTGVPEAIRLLTS